MDSDSEDMDVWLIKLPCQIERGQFLKGSDARQTYYEVSTPAYNKIIECDTRDIYFDENIILLPMELEWNVKW